MRAGHAGTVFLFLLALALALPQSALADVSGSADATNQGFDVVDGVYQRAGGQHSRTGGPSRFTYSVKKTTRCALDDPVFGGCREGFLDCPTAPPDDAENQWRLTVVTVTDTVTGDETHYAECLNYVVLQGTVTPELARQEILRRLPKATFALSPDTRGIVNLPEIVSVNEEPLLTFDVNILGQPVVLRATAERYDWTFGDGAGLSVTTPGAPYDRTIPCRTDATCDGYLHHTYPAAGTYRVAVTVVWHGEFAVAGGAFQDIPARVSLTSQAVPLPVVEAQVLSRARG